MCKEECNSFGLYEYAKDGKKNGYGLALYPHAVYFNHSCAPNVVHGTVKNATGVPNQVFYAAQNVKKGHELCIAYINVRKSRAERQLELREVFLFDCGCSRCIVGVEDTAPSTVCQDSTCSGVYMPVSTTELAKWQCESCGGEQDIAEE